MLSKEYEMIIKNQSKHFLVANYVGLVLGTLHWLLLKIPNTQMSFWWFMVLVAAGFMLKFEFSQAPPLPSGSNLLIRLKYWWHSYWKIRWLDSTLDWLAGMVGSPGRV
jgi:hypothetical protein